MSITTPMKHPVAENFEAVRCEGSTFGKAYIHNGENTL